MPDEPDTGSQTAADKPIEQRWPIPPPPDPDPASVQPAPPAPEPPPDPPIQTA